MVSIGWRWALTDLSFKYSSFTCWQCVHHWMVSAGHFLIFMGKGRKPPATTCTFSFLRQSEGSVPVWAPPLIFCPLLTCRFPVGNDSSLQSKQLLALNGNAHLLSPYCEEETPGQPRRDKIDLPLISTMLTFKPQPLIEHWVISLCVCSTVPGSQGSVFTEVGQTRDSCSDSHTATDGRGSGAGLGEAPSPNLKCTQYHMLLEPVP